MLRFKIKSQKATIGKHKGKTIYYPQQEAQGRMTLSAVENEIVQRTSLSKGDVRNAIASLAEVVNSALLNGLMVDLGDLGSFKVVARGRYSLSEQEVSVATIKKPHIIYYPKAEMKQYAERVPVRLSRGQEDTTQTSEGGSQSSAGGSGSVGTGGSL